MSFSNCSLPVLGFAAFSGTGKTTLLEQLIPLLVESGIRIAMVKHAHHDFDVDKPGKDSFRLRKAGAEQMLISSRRRHALMTETADGEYSLNQLLNRLDQTRADLVLVEGFKHERFPKIELHRETLGKPWLFPDDSNIVAVACDSQPATALPRLDINNITAIRDFILRWMEGHKAQTATCDSLSPTMLSVDAGREKILTALNEPTAKAWLPLEALHGQVLAEDVVAPVNVPSSTNSAMDGYAIRSDDIGRDRYRIVGEVFAGHHYRETLNQGECVRIMTGAPVPQDADTVIMREQATVDGDLVRFDTSKGAVRAGQNVRQAGEDLKYGATVFSAGSRMNAASVGMMASLGMDKACCFKPIKVALFSTGDEVQAPGTEAKENCIYDANRFTLRSLLEQLGCEVLDLGIIEDSEQSLTDTLTNAMENADMVMSSGGVSVGDADYIKTVLANLGDINFWRVNMRPGRPLAFGKLGDTPFFGLPGNPVAVMVTFLQFVEPAIRKMQGDKFWQPQRISAITQEKIRSRLGRTEYTRGIYSIGANGQLEVRSTGSQGSGILRSMYEANCLIEVSPEVENAETGDRVTIIPLASRL
ncbi:bifunctional molybdopterin-guanine dinucleotide biosynthesis adaptor protein MobB/molybdopterin molybdotransferase MoeA [Enterovibrio paralichthyis]|uniref:bifunctional molybdopterin-guanine dinucleotide biosynthesis adaptor protein MobB/molybdopterin molybdotransferase MoeA n=1 Tax=Enterovibrio paralichthyis TaxID=2853805 RepID=UPI001C4798C5|nr:bifunctional molybdopterin-guanine dinucleotide biosynthesis adaptor protein MobB/molybdopterin molybdotransferase MoeA [Enterovibrio paralichthyis]MBV7299537.1 bifunctional molybdopterin-guanine dinucleotide biosynthesis adaptor protein MobB/molybdopterin molybdotransferase MoeA [Enterovibrio paralichthyis]